jgi:hypothetical protein
MCSTFTPRQVFTISQNFRDKGVHMELIENLGEVDKKQLITLMEYNALCTNAPYRANQLTPVSRNDPLKDYLIVPDVGGIISYKLFTILSNHYQEVFPFLLQLQMKRMNINQQYCDVLRANQMEGFLMRI